MPMNFMDLKRSKNNIDKYAKKIEDLNSRGFAKDPRYFFPKQDKAGNGFALIRFLPEPKGEDFPFVRKFHYSIQGPGGWYIEDSLATIDKDDPVAQRWFKARNEKDEKLEKMLSRKVAFISNIYVIKHPSNPEDEGKVFLYQYGKKVFDMITEAQQPPEALGKEPMDPFSLWEGSNFQLRLYKNGQGWNQYDKCRFEDGQSPLLNDDKALEKIWESTYSLAGEIAPSKFKSYEDLEKKLERVLSGSDDSKDSPRARVKEDQAPRRQEAEASSHPETEAEEASEDDVDFFKKMAAEG